MSSTGPAPSSGDDPRDLDVPIAPVAREARPRGPWLVVAAIVAVIALAAVSSRLFPAGPEPTRPAVPTPRGPTASPAATVAYPVLDVRGFRASLNAGDLAAELVIVEGGMQRQPVPCPSGAGDADCWYLEVVGLEGVPIEIPAALVGLVRTDVPGGTLAFRAGTGTLTYLGDVRGALGRPLTTAELVDGGLQGLAGRGAEVLTPVSGWLVVGGIHTCFRPSGRTPCPSTSPWLTDTRPTDQGLLVDEQGMAVQVDAGVRSRPDQVVTEGPFLVRRLVGEGDLPPWHVTARLDADGMVLVALP